MENPKINITERDLFALVALHAFLTRNAKFADIDNPTEKNFACASYKVADAMLEEKHRHEQH